MTREGRERRETGGRAAAAAPTRTPARIPTRIPAPRPPSRPPAPAGRREQENNAALWWKTSLRILLATLLVGLIPVALAGQVLGIWRLTLPGIGAPFAPALSYSPSSLYVAADISVLPQPGAGDEIARLGAGFPVQAVEQQSVDGAVWLRVTWLGPSHAGGGSGWVRETSLVSYAARARMIGDLGALAPPLRAASTQRHVTAALYFPDGGQLYLSAAADQPFPLAGGIRAVLLAALFANAATQGQPAPPAAPGTPAALVANGDATATASVYTQLGDAAGVGAYLARLGVSGIALAPGQLTAATATPRALLTFYAALMTTNTLSSTSRTTMLGLLAQSEATPLAPASLIGSGGALVTGEGGAGTSWTASAAGQLAPTQGHRVIVAAIATADSAAPARGALAAWYAQLATTLGA